MESLISHLIKNPSWANILALTSLILFGFLTLFMFIEAYNDEKDENKTNNKLGIKYIFYFLGILLSIITPIMLVAHKVNEYNKIVQNKEYILTKKGKILTIKSENEFLPQTDLEIIYDDDKEMQIKVDNELFTINKNSETINDK